MGCVVAYCCDTQSEDFHGTKVASGEERVDGRGCWLVGGGERGDEMGEEEDLKGCLEDVNCVVEVVVVVGRLVT